MKFSERMGLTQVRTVLQIDSIDDNLTKRIWNNVQLDFFSLKGFTIPQKQQILPSVLKNIWLDYLVEDIDEIPKHVTGAVYSEGIILRIKQSFFSSEWYQKYEFLEFILPLAKHLKLDLEAKLNRSLELGGSGFRIIDGLFTKITSESEINEIEESFEKTSKLNSVNSHLRLALKYLSDRENPDYRNSVKESISAVESICKIISGKENSTLGDALKVLKTKKGLHPSLEKSFSSLYGYTSSAGGIRHGLKEDDEEVTFEEAKLILVTSSAFINFLIAKLLT